MTTNISASAIQRALEQFDSERRLQFWKNWDKHPSASWAIAYNGKLYPVTNVMGIIDRKYEMKSIMYLRNILQAKGYSVIQLWHATRENNRNDTNTTHKPQPPRFGMFINEKIFCDDFVAPLFEKMGYNPEKEYKCTFYTGGKPYHGRIDLMVFDKDMPITVVETKKCILAAAPPKDYVEQAKSYALHHGIGTFIIAAPEGIWLYKLTRNIEILLRQYKPKDMTAIMTELPQLIKDHK